MVPFVTSAARTDATSAPWPCIIVTPATVRVVETRVADDFDDADETPIVPAVSATVVITIAAIFFFVDICMSPHPVLCAETLVSTCE